MEKSVKKFCLAQHNMDLPGIACWKLMEYRMERILGRFLSGMDME